MIQALTSNFSDDAFAIWILPRRKSCHIEFLDVYAFDASREVIVVDAIVVAVDMLRPTSSARHSRVNSSVIANHFSIRLLTVRSWMKSHVQISSLCRASSAFMLPRPMLSVGAHSASDATSAYLSPRPDKLADRLAVRQHRIRLPLLPNNLFRRMPFFFSLLHRESPSTLSGSGYSCNIWIRFGEQATITLKSFDFLTESLL